MPIPFTPETRDLHIAHYNDHGNWARHYSTVRMTVGTFFLTSSFAILGLQWKSPDRALGLFVAIYITVGWIMFLGFSHLTFRKLRQQREMAKEARIALGITKDNPEDIGTPWSGWPLGTLLFLMLLFLDAYWALR